MPQDLPLHWNTVYEKSLTTNLGWYEPEPQPSFDLIKSCDLPKDARIFHAGSGASTLIDAMLEDGFSQLIASDLSEAALQTAKERLGQAAHQIEWIVDDLTQPTILPGIPQVDLWHDRAVLHFFIEKKDQQTYFDLLQKLVKPGGFVIIAAFSLKGAKMCSGLPIKNYDADLIATHLGPSFKLLKSFDHIYHMPSGDERPYVYTLFQHTTRITD